MTSIKGLVAMGALMVVLGGTGAMAADMYGGSVKDGYIPAYTQVSEPTSASWYFRVDGAHARHDDPIRKHRSLR